MRDTKKYLTLVNDEIHLTEELSDDVQIVKSFSHAVLGRDGVLNVTPSSDTKCEESFVVSDVFPRKDVMPKNCNDIIYFGLENQIVIITCSMLDKFHHYETSTFEEIAQSFEKDFKIFPPKEKDALVIRFRNRQRLCIFADKPDCVQFKAVLSDETLRLKFLRKNSVCLIYDVCGKKIVVAESQKNAIFDTVEQAWKHCVNSVRVFTHPLQFRTD